MKTQISNLINGSKSVKRDLSNAKYINAPGSTSFGDFAGTNSEIRKSIAEQVFAENGSSISIEIAGLNLILSKHTSTTGKTSFYEVEITEAQFMQISGYAAKPFNKHEGSFSLKIYGDMTVVLSKFARRNSNCQWKMRGYDYIGEEFVTILDTQKSSKMKTYVELINVVFNENYSEAEGFNMLAHAIEKYEQIKNRFFDEKAEETIYESGEREITDGEDKLTIEFITKTCSDSDFEMLHPASVATL